MDSTDTKPKSLLAAVAPASWQTPIHVPDNIAEAPDQRRALKASLRLTLARDLASVAVDSDVADAITAMVFAAVHPIFDEGVSLADATAVCLLVERLTLAVVLTYEQARAEDADAEWLKRPHKRND